MQGHFQFSLFTKGNQVFRCSAFCWQGKSQAFFTIINRPARNKSCCSCLGSFNLHVFTHLDKSPPPKKNQQQQQNIHAQYFWNGHNKLVLLWILAASAGGLLCSVAEHLSVGLKNCCHCIVFHSLLFYDPSWRGPACPLRGLVIIGLSSWWCWVWEHYQMVSSNSH